MSSNADSFDELLGDELSNRSSDARLAAALEELEAAFKKGSSDDREAILKKYSDIADLLEPCLDGLSFLYNAVSKPVELKVDGETPFQLDDYRIVREIGRGGMGIVYEAVQVSLNRRVALKIFPMAAILDERQLARFQNEVQAAAMLDHRHIVSVYSVGSDKGVHYYVMQLINGQNLAQVIDELRGVDSIENQTNERASEFVKRLQAQRQQSPDSGRRHYFQAVARLGVEIAETLHYAHQEGIIHRDVKPANLLVDVSGSVYVSDFGLARIESNMTMTMTGDVLGTLRYMSPEQALGKHQVIDHRTDVYSLGVTLYELLTHKVPFDGENREEVFRQVTMLDAPPLHRIQSGIPCDLATVIHKAIEKVPGERYDTAADFADDLQRFVEGRPVKARPTGWMKRLWSRAKRNPKIATAAGGAVIAMVTALVLMFQLSAANVRAKAERIHASRTAYANDMRAVDAAILVGKPDHAQEILEKYVKGQEESKDLRGFEWFCLRRMLNSERTAFCGHRSAVRSIAISPDDSLIVTGGWDETVRFWNAKSGKLFATKNEPTYRVDCMAFINDGKWLITGDTALRVWDVESQKEIVRLENKELGQESVLRLALSKDESLLATGGTHSVRLWKVERTDDQPRFIAFESDPYREVIHGQFIRSVALSPDGKSLAYSSSVEPQYVLWDVNAQKRIATVDESAGGHTDQVTSLAFSPDGSQLASASWDKSIKLWSTIDWKCKKTINGHHDVIRQIQFTPEGKTILSGGRDRNLNIWNVANGRLAASLPGHAADILTVAVAGSGKLVATGGRRNPLAAEQTSQEGGGVVKLWNVLERREVKPVYPKGEKASVGFEFPGKHVTGVNVSSNGQLLVIGLDSGELHVGSVAEESINKLAEFDTPVCAVSFMLNEQQVAVATKEDLQLCDITTGTIGAATQVLEHPSDKEHIWYVEPSEGDSSVNLATNYGRLYSWDGRNESVCKELASSPNGRRYGPIALSRRQFTTIDNGAIICRDTLSGRTLHKSFTEHHVTSLAVATDSGLIATGHREGTVRLVDMNSGKMLHELRGHLEEVTAIAFTDDGLRLATGSKDSTVRIWDAVSGLQLLTLRNHEGIITHIAFDKEASCMVVATKISYRNGLSCVVVWKTAQTSED